MEVNVGIQTKLKLGGKYVAHKIQQFRAATHELVVTNTSYGQVRGHKRTNVNGEHGQYFSFEGIPYAKPPLAELRFRAPQPPEPWQGILECTTYKSKPVQYNMVAKWVEGSEDCLYLNVYTKKIDSDKPLPVMVWIYGGGYQVGEASRDVYGPDYFMQQDMILITFNYRLGVLGFLCLDDPQLNIPGNAGLKDQVLALKWIKENIHNFNGDPNNITVFGESAGGASTQFMMMTPQTKGLFHKAIIQSGSILCPWSSTDRHDWGYKYACHIGYTGENNDRSVFEYLSQKSAKNLAFHDVAMMTKDDLMDNLLVLFRPVVEPYVTDNCVVHTSFKDLLATGWGNAIPLVIGGNSFEGLLHYATVQKYPFLIDDLSDFVNLLPDDVKRSHSEQKLKEMALRLKEVYFGGENPNSTHNLFQYLNLLSYRSFWHGIFRSIRGRGKYAAQVPTYCYFFDFDSEFNNIFRSLICGPSVRGTCHADELSYLFHGAVSENVDPNTKEHKCLQLMIGMWYNFALTSNPNCKEMESVLWKPIADYSAPIECLSINEDLEFRDLPLFKNLEIWDAFYLKDELI